VECTGCGHVNREAARFCDQCGHPLAAPAAPAPSRGYTPRHLAERILRDRSALQGERKQVTVLFADLKGSMALSERLDPEHWHRILDRYFSVLSDAVHRYEGTVNQYTGDGIMALFGAPLAHEDHAERACLAALQMRAQLEALAGQLREELPAEAGFDFRARIGLNSGDVIVGKIGDDLRMDYTAQGHTVGLASRIEQLAAPGQAYLTGTTARLVEGLFELRSEGARVIKGVSDPVDVFALLGRGPLRTRLQRAQAVGLAPFVARESELETLQREFSAARERGRGRVVALIADPGVGKSRLCEEFATRCRSGGFAVREAHALAHSSGLSLSVARDLALSALSTDRETALSDALDRRLTAGGTDVTTLSVVAEFLGAAGRVETSSLDPESRQQRLFDGLAQLIGISAEPVLIRVEDLQWTDAGSVRFLETLAARMAAPDDPICGVLLVTFRPDYRADWLNVFEPKRIALKALDRADAQRLLDTWIGADPSLAPLRPLVFEQAQGNALYTEEIVRALVQTGLLSGARGTYRLAVDVASLDVPDSVQSIVAARVDRLAAAHKELLQIASVVGSRFAAPLVGAVARWSSDETEASVAELEAMEFIAADPGRDATHRFAHPLTQEVVYRGQLSDRRSDLHRRVAQVLLDGPADATPERAAVLAHHFDAAGDGLDAARWHEAAGRRIARNDPASGLRHCRRVGELLANEPDSQQSLTLGLTSRIATLEIGRLSGASAEESARVYEEASGVAERLGDARGSAFLMSSYGVLRGQLGDVAGHCALCERAVSTARATGDARFGFEMDARLLLALIAVGRLADAERVAEHGLEQLASDSALRRSSSTAADWMRIRAGWVFGWRGRFEQADALLRPPEPDSAEIWERLYGASGLRAEVARLRGDPQSALAHGERALETARQAGGISARIDGAAFLAPAHIAVGEFESAEAIALAALELARTHNTALWTESRLLAVLAEAAAGAGNLETARARVDEAETLVRRRRGWRIGAIDAARARLRVAQLCGESVEGASAQLAELIAETGAAAYAN
jgi:class 3 adenylate cyclase/tetratricopeptide (TPR) repeat protein